MRRLFRRLFGRRVQQATCLARSELNGFLAEATGVIHVGANTGQERSLYDKHGLDVVWIEPIPEIFHQLEVHLRGYPRQRAYQYLVTDRDDRSYEFHVANNQGASSSVLNLGLHRDIWPTVQYERTLILQGTSLSSLVQRECIDMRRFDALVLDTQGSELLVLEGAKELMPNFRFVKTEVPDFESYEGCCQLTDIQAFLEAEGFKECSRDQFAVHPSGGGYYDIMYRRAA